MPPHDNDDSRRNRGDTENNPFVAFRRFADSQVSALLNTVLTLPATLANTNDSAHYARNLCLFGKADERKCDKLHELEDKTKAKVSESLRMFQTGDIDALESMGGELDNLARETNTIRGQIIQSAEAKGYAARGSDEHRKETDLVEKVANAKGQEWAGDWDWDWAFPRPFDQMNNKTLDDEQDGRRRWRRRCSRRDMEESNHQDEHVDHSRRCQRWQRRRDAIAQRRAEANEEPEVWTWSFQFPPPGDLHTDMSARIGGPSYLPFSLENDNTMKKAGISWRDAYEDLVRTERGEPLIPHEQLGQSNRVPYPQWVQRLMDPKPNWSLAQPSTPASPFPKRVPWEGEERNEEPSYEYAHDHEDQHDEPPTPKLNQGKFTQGMPATELDAYERLLGPSTSSGDGSKPSVLSTLTTTERTISPDGTVTTKMVLRKRFADGREESSETVHTQRGQEIESLAPTPNSTTQHERTTKKSGWFWSN